MYKRLISYKRNKKVQVSIYIILILVIFFSLTFFILNSKIKIPESEVYFEKDSTEELKNCIRFGIYDSLKINGLDENKNLYFIKNKLLECQNFFLNQYKNNGYSYQKSNPSIKLMIEKNLLILKVDMFIKVYNDKNTLEINSFDLEIPLSNNYRINPGNEEIVFSIDKQARLIIPKNNNIDKVLSVKMTDKNFDNLENNIVVSNIYEFSPEGYVFDEPVILEIDEPKNNFLNSEDVAIAWWDEKEKIWKGLKTEYKNDRYIAKVNHFTKFALVVNCNSNNNNKNIIEIPTMFMQKYNYILNKNLNEDDQEYSKRYIDTIIGFCKNEVISGKKEKFWQENDDGTISPTREEFLKILENNEEKIDLSLQSLDGEKYSFDGSDECENEVEVNVYCCCLDYNSDGNPDHCLETPLSQQECWSKKDNGFYYDTYNYLEVDLCPKDSNLYTKVKRNIIGYNNRKCIGGNIKDGNNDGNVLELVFDEKGNSCIFEDETFNIIPVYNGIVDSEKCKINSNIEKSNGYKIVINSVEVKEPEENYCANCAAILQFYGTGIIDYKINKICNENEKAKLVLDNNGYSCKKCIMANEGDYYMTSDEEANIEDCLCNENLLGVAYCDYKKKCDLVDNKPKLIDWQENSQYQFCEICTPLNRDIIKGCEKVVFLGE